MKRVNSFTGLSWLMVSIGKLSVCTSVEGAWIAVIDTGIISSTKKLVFVVRTFLDSTP